MGQNLWTYENIYPYHMNSYGQYNGEWTLRNGVWAIVMAPSRFYASGTYAHIFSNEFKPNTCYLFNFYVDTDDHYHNDKYTSAGIYIGFSDGTESNVLYATQSTVARGWQQKRYVSPADKSVAYVRMGYNYGDPSYYRWDSYIVPYETEKIYHTGLTTVSHLSEGANKTDFRRGGGVDTNEIIEF